MKTKIISNNHFFETLRVKMFNLGKKGLFDHDNPVKLGGFQFSQSTVMLACPIRDDDIVRAVYFKCRPKVFKGASKSDIPVGQDPNIAA
jgi:hypothetical protein